METKVCKHCGEDKPLTKEMYSGSYLVSGKFSYNGVCKVCTNKAHALRLQKYRQEKESRQEIRDRKEFVNWNEDAIYC